MQQPIEAPFLRVTVICTTFADGGVFMLASRVS
jgi:hypothetical protein